MSLSNIEAALVQAYQGAGLSLSTKYENAPFDEPSIGTPWAAVFFVPNQPDAATLGDGGSDEFDGFLQIDIYTPRDTGTKAARDYCELLRAQFSAGARFSYGGQSVIVESCGRNQGQVADGFFKVSNTVIWRSFVNR